MSEPKDINVSRRLREQAEQLENLALEAESRSSFQLNGVEEEELGELVKFLRGKLGDIRLANLRARLDDIDNILKELVGELEETSAYQKRRKAIAKFNASSRFLKKGIALNPVGTGPFTFTEYVSGDHWSGKRFDGYFKDGKPYLDSFRNQLVSGPAATNAIAGGELHGNIRFISVPAKDQMQSARGDELTFQVTPSTSTSLIDVNTRKPPFDDLRVRRALSLAIDRNIGVQALGDQAGQRWAHLIFRHGHEMAPTDEELKSYPGFGDDIEAAREEARNLLKEAGQSDLSFTLINRNLPVPYEPLAIFFIDQWRQIGVNVKHEPLDTAAWAGRLSSGDYEVGIDLNAPSSDDPTDVLLKYVPGSSADRTGIEDAKLVELFEQQNRTLDEAERAKLAKEFVDRAVDLLYVIPTFNAERLIVLDSKVKGWKVPPSFYVGLDLADVWIDE